MKLKLYKALMGGVALMMCATSCSDWFDISPKTNVKADELFTTETGFESALAGIYITSTDRGSYGYEWTFGFMEELAQSYNNLPSTVDPVAYYSYTENVSNVTSKSTLASMWAKSYNLIANANNLLTWMEANGDAVFTNSQKRNTITGEALALRAFYHFDLLRGWGPIYSQNPTQASIPYRKAATNEKLPLLPANQVAELVLADIADAKTYLDYEKGESLAGSERRFRLNYWAVVALEARVNLYMGNKDKAFDLAKEVVENCGLDLGSTNNGDPSYTQEMLFGLDIYKMGDNYTDVLTPGPTFNNHIFCTLTTLNDIFEKNGIGVNDLRGRENAFFIHEDIQRCITRKFQTTINDHYIVPLIRLPEMYYIMAECAPLNEGANYLKTLIEYRGISDSPVFTDEARRLDLIAKDFRKEYYAEGQFFFFAKQHGLETFVNCPTTMTAQQYVFPTPDAEKEYGWTDGSETGNSEN